MVSLLALAVLATAPAEGVSTEVVTEPRVGPFERTFGLSAYGTGWAGAYGAGGLGGRLRVQPFARVGLDLFSEHLLVTSPSGLRHDHPAGFHLYMPFRLSERVQLRPFLGMCIVYSATEPDEAWAPRVEDMLVGAHLGAGVDVALHSRLSFFAEAKALGWMGHDRAVQGWTGAVDNEVKIFPLAQAQVGLTVHLGQR